MAHMALNPYLKKYHSTKLFFGQSAKILFFSVQIVIFCLKSTKGTFAMIKYDNQTCSSNTCVIFQINASKLLFFIRKSNYFMSGICKF